MDEFPPTFEVVWSDSWFDADETEAEYWPERWLVHTVGFLVRDDSDVLHLAAEILQDGQYRAVTHIPRVLVVSCTQVKSETVKEVN